MSLSLYIHTHKISNKYIYLIKILKFAFTYLNLSISFNDSIYSIIRTNFN